MEGIGGGVGSGSRALTVPDLLRRIDDGGDGLGVGTGGVDRLVCRGAGTTAGAFTGGIGSFRGERG